VSRYRRWNELLELLAADGQLQVDRAAEVLGVSAATVRQHIKIVAAEVDVLVTDTGITPADAARLADAGVKVVTA